MQLTDKDIVKFNKLLQTRLPRDLKTKFFVKLYQPVNAKNHELVLTATKSSDHYLTIDHQFEFSQDELKDDTLEFATINFNADPNSKQYTLQLNGFSYLISYGEIDATINYTLDEARDIMTAITAFIDTAKEYFE